MKNRNTIFTTMLFVLGCFAISPLAQAVSPSPDGGYPGGNTAEGQTALLSLTTGGFNTAVGYLALRSDTTASFNTAIGAGTLAANTSFENTATGAGALSSNIGPANTANGAFALFSNTAGSENTADGETALFGNTMGNSNTAVGAGALFHSTGSNNTALGQAAGLNVTTADNVICIGEFVEGANVSNTCFIGNIRGVTTVNNDAVPVFIDSNGQLGTASSSRRYKTDIKPMDEASESILALKPVSFRYKVHKDTTPQFGLIAEEVAEVNPDLVVRDEKGEIYTVRYDAVNAMLLNEFLKEHCKVENLEITVAQQRKEFQKATTQQQKEVESKLAEQQRQIEALTVGLDKVSAQLETTRRAPQIVLNNQ